METPSRRSRAYNTMTMELIPGRSPRGPLPFVQRILHPRGCIWKPLGLPQVSGGFPRLVSVMPWVSSKFPPGRLGFPQVSVPLVQRFFDFAMRFHRYVFIACFLRSGVHV